MENYFFVEVSRKRKCKKDVRFKWVILCPTSSVQKSGAVTRITTTGARGHLFTVQKPVVEGSFPALHRIRGVSVNCHPGEVFNYKCKLVGKRNSGHRYWTKARSASKSVTNCSIGWGNYEAFFEPISQRGKRGFPLGLELKKNWSEFGFRQKNGILLRLVQDPASQNDQPFLRLMKGVTEACSR